MIGPDTPQMSWALYQWLAARGVSNSTLMTMTTLRLVNGVLADDGLLDVDPAGPGWLTIYDEASDDAVFWQPETDLLATWRGRAFALGEDNIANAASYAFDTSLYVHATVLDWLRDECRGIVVVNWFLAFDRLRDAPRVAVAEALLPLYRSHMQPNLPHLAVLTENWRLAA